MAQTCKCKRGKASVYDGKCGHCRSPREQKQHIMALDKAINGVSYADALLDVQLKWRGR